MKIITLDWETHYATDYSLSKLTTEEYVRDPRFESILMSVKIGDAPTYWVPKPDIERELQRLDMEHNAMLSHHIHFDGLIANHHYGVRPKLMLDTLGMARALHGSNGQLSLAKLADRYGLRQKGTEVHNVKGMRFADFTVAGLQRYGDYSCLDTDLCYELAQRMLPHFSRQELEIHDQIIRMFTEPVFRLDVPTLEKYVRELAENKARLLEEAGADKDSVMSNAKFADILRGLGVEPPLKQSPSWLKKPEDQRDPAKEWTYAFSKTDKAMQELQNHEDERVQAVVEARLENKSTIMEKGGLRMIGMAGRGPAPIYLKYSGASGTHRLSAGDKINWQALKRGSPLRDAVTAEEGKVCVAGDSSNIEARIVDWLSGQDDMVEVYRRADRKEGPDAYCVLASRIYKREVLKAEHPMERQMGKVAKLGLGFGMGHEKFISTVRAQAKDENKKPLIITPEFSKEVVGIYRVAHPQVQKLWKRGGDALRAIAEGRCGMPVDYRGIVVTCKDGLQMPGGLKILFPDLQFKKAAQGWGGEWTFWNGKEREKIYGAKLIENCLAEGTQVLTDRGWVPIEYVRLTDLVHDGVDFVQHGGVIFKSVQDCVAIDGVYMTPDHKVLTDEGWKPALEKPEPFWPEIRHADCASYYGKRRQEDELGVPVRLREQDHKARSKSYPRTEAWTLAPLRVHDETDSGQDEQNSRHEPPSSVRGMAQHERPMPATYASSLEKLRRAWHHGMQAVAGVFREFLGGYGARLSAGAYVGTRKQLAGLQQGQLRVEDLESASTESARLYWSGSGNDVGGDRDSEVDALLPIPARSTSRKVYDILNCGPRTRFVVRGNTAPFIVHNCVQCLARIIVFEQCRVTAKECKGIAKWAHSVHDEGVFVTPLFYAPYVLEKLLSNMRIPPAWAPDLPLNSEGGFHERYGKCKP